jgi:hypothetical protein
MRVVRNVLLVGLLVGLSVTPDALAAEWVPPLDTVSVARPFSPPPKPWQSGHRGVDLETAAGASVRAAGAGVVTFAGPIAGRGVVTVSHGALRTTYEPVDAAVAAGDQVVAGQVIGQVQTHGDHCGGAPPCLHWGLLRGTEYLDPMALIGRGRPILLPYWDVPEPGNSVTTPGAALALGLVGMTALVIWRKTRVDLRGRSARRSSPVAGARPWCASGRCGSP